MVEYEIISMPFLHDDSFNPLMTVITALSSKDNITMLIIKDALRLSIKFQLDEKNEEIFCQEIVRSGFNIKNNIVSEYISHYIIARHIPNNDEVFLPISANHDRIKMLLTKINTFEPGTGIAFVFRGHRELRKQTLQKLSEIPLDLPLVIAPDSSFYGFSCYPVATTVENEDIVAKIIVSCYRGLSASRLEEANIVQNINPQTRYDYIWKNELSSVIIGNELDSITSILFLLDDFIKDRNMDTMFSSRRVERPAVDPEKIESIKLGTTFHEEPIYIPLISLRQNIFIAGAPGTGKGNLLISIAKQLSEHHVQFLIIESAKRELHHLRELIPDLRVWRPGPGRFVLNPFALPEDLTKLEYGDSLQTIIKTCFNISWEGTPFPGLFSEALNDCFVDYNFDSSSSWISNPNDRFGINEFIAKFNELMQYENYADDVRNNVRQAGLNRAKELISTQMRYIYDTIDTIPVKQLLSGYNVLQLEPYLGSIESKQFFMTILLIQINAWLRHRFKNIENKDLNLVIMIDESHNVLQNIENPNGGTFSFLKDFQKNLLEHRSSGIGPTKH